jgi:DNA replication regulator SLD2
MAIAMDENLRAEYESQSQQLRIDLKTWETEWAKTHEGKKPGRGDIKANEDIGKSFEKQNNRHANR